MSEVGSSYGITLACHYDTNGVATHAADDNVDFLFVCWSSLSSHSNDDKNAWCQMNVTVVKMMPMSGKNWRMWQRQCSI